MHTRSGSNKVRLHGPNWHMNTPGKAREREARGDWVHCNCAGKSRDAFVTGRLTGIVLGGRQQHEIARAKKRRNRAERERKRRERTARRAYQLRLLDA